VKWINDDVQSERGRNAGRLLRKGEGGEWKGVVIMRVEVRDVKEVSIGRCRQGKVRDGSGVE
jgi:hypothetical protein